MEIYTIRRGVMRAVPEDYELKQCVKYIVAVLFGMYVGYRWDAIHSAAQAMGL